VPAIVAQVLAERVAGFVHAYTMYWSVRPFGVSVLIATKDSDGDSIWMVEPSGLTYRSVHTPQVPAGTHPEDLDEKLQASSSPHSANTRPGHTRGAHNKKTHLSSILHLSLFLSLSLLCTSLLFFPSEYPPPSHNSYSGCAIGKGKQASKVELEKLKLTEMTCRLVLIGK
jgi:hypothetical protein